MCQILASYVIANSCPVIENNPDFQAVSEGNMLYLFEKAESYKIQKFRDERASEWYLYINHLLQYFIYLEKFFFLRNNYIAYEAELPGVLDYSYIKVVNNYISQIRSKLI